ncbi:MAG: hypothetical protein AELANPGJ_03586 [Anaerolineae bacterium]|nr:hypothetical protein [Anaerolineae bacterium]
MMGVMTMKLSNLSIRDIINLCGEGLLSKRAYEFQMIYEMLAKHLEASDNDEPLFFEFYRFPDAFFIWSFFEEPTYAVLDLVTMTTPSKIEAIEILKIALAILEESMIEYPLEESTDNAFRGDTDDIKHEDNDLLPQAGAGSTQEPSQRGENSSALSRDNSQINPKRNKRH